MNEIENRTVVSISAPDYPNGYYRGWSPCIEWCDQTFESGWWYITEGVFEFNREQDALLFKLRWA